LEIVTNNQTQIEAFLKFCEQIQFIKNETDKILSRGLGENFTLDIFVNATLNIGSMLIPLNINVGDLEAVKWVMNGENMKFPLRIAADNGTMSGSIAFKSENQVKITALADNQNLTLGVDARNVTKLPASIQIDQLEFSSIDWRYSLGAGILKLILIVTIAFLYFRLQKLKKTIQRSGNGGY